MRGKGRKEGRTEGKEKEKNLSSPHWTKRRLIQTNNNRNMFRRELRSRRALKSNCLKVPLPTITPRTKCDSCESLVCKTAAWRCVTGRTLVIRVHEGAD